MPRLLATLALLTLLAACGSPCEDLGDRVCLCQPPGALRDACKQAVRDQIGDGNPRPGQSQQDFCEAKLRSCPNPSSDANACQKQATAEGKVQCGLAYEPTGT